MWKIGSKLLILRTSRRMNQTDFAAIFDMSRPTYAQYESDSKAVDRELLYRMSKALNITEADLTGDTLPEKHTSVPKVGPPEDISPERYLKDLQKLNAYQAKELEDQDRKLKEKDKQIVQLQKELENLRRRT